MELKEFIKQSIIEISEAVKEANDYAEENKLNIIINPNTIHAGHAGERSRTDDEDYGDMRYIEDIEFDVAVTAGGEISGEAKGGIKILSFQAGGGGSITDTQQNVSRIKFMIPVCLPTGKYKK